MAGPSRQCQRQACYLVVGLRLGLPKGPPGLQATGGRVGDLCGPASFSRPRDAPHPAQNSFSLQEALQETSCCPELLTSLNGTELCQRNSWREERARESEREGGRGRKLGWPRAGAASCVEWGPPEEAGGHASGDRDCGWCLGGRWQGPLGMTHPSGRRSPARSSAHHLSANQEHMRAPGSCGKGSRPL